MAETELESKEGMNKLKSWNVWAKEWWVFLWDKSSKQEAVSWQSLLNMAWVAETLLILTPLQSVSRREQKQVKWQA